MSIRIKSIFIFFIITISAATAQNYEQLLERKKQLIKNANQLNNALLEIKSNEEHTLESLILVNTKIDLQLDIIAVLNKEIEELKQEEHRLEKETKYLTQQLDLVKKKYATLIQVTHQLYRNYNRLLFFLSSQNFNQFIRRIYQIKQIESNRRDKYYEIEDLYKKINNKHDLITTKKIKQSELSITKESELTLLQQAQKLKENTIQVLKNKSDSLSNVLKKEQLEQKSIEKEILEILQNRENKNKELTPELKLVSSKFQKNKGRLPWPVHSGTVISEFGESPHPVLSGITTMNNGVEIATSENTVRAVFGGEITRVIILPTGLKVVIIRHGEYLTVYSNLAEVNVKKGEEVKIKDYIGALYFEKGKRNKTFGFQIWRNREKLDPMSWLSSY